MRLCFALACLSLTFSSACSTVSFLPHQEDLIRRPQSYILDAAELRRLIDGADNDDTTENNCVINVKPIFFPNFSVTINFDSGTNNTPVNLDIATSSSPYLAARKADGSLFDFAATDLRRVVIDNLYAGAPSPPSVVMNPNVGPLMNYPPTGTVPVTSGVEVIVVRNYNPTTLNPNSVDLVIRRGGKQVTIRFERNIPPV